MAFVPEDGTGLADANSFCAVADADAYFDDRGVTDWITLDDTVKEQLLIQATDYINVRWYGMFKGTICTTTQALEWPRFLTTDQTMPQPLPAQLIKATSEYALRAKAGPLAPDPVVDPSGYGVTKTHKKVGPIEKDIQYADKGPGSVPQYLRPYPAADMLLRPLLNPGMTTGRVIRN